ncbi:chromosome transmission fidelity protein 18 homolog [Gigantopelta aegis]|uniref:chromosome transmission fidelity protein 18 homolog n=1 Tax=Gigantopelta aegis TaxID=1735272 RepID=UPI001B888AE3|nr:chromosome transmission fidelity protein 18 homolog [Gigantopelta aegis]
MAEFEDEYADELDALEEFDYPDEDLRPKSKKSLHFTTPKNKCLTGEAKSPPSPTPLTPLDSVQVGNGSFRLSSLGGGAEKRPRDTEYSQLSGSEDDCLPHIVSRSKRARLETTTPESRCEEDDSMRGPSPPPPVSQTPKSVIKTPDSHPAHSVRNGTRHHVQTSRPSGKFIPVTSVEGERVYLKVFDVADLEKEYDGVGKSIHTAKLLDVPLFTLREQAEEERGRKIIQEAREITAKINRTLDEDLGMVEDGDKENVLPLDTPEPQQFLWVDKYAPRQYTELLSEETLNRSLLHWLKLWDHVVFDKELPAQPKVKKKQKENTFKKRFQPEIIEGLDKLNRPQQKVALLCGPPGLGKTTLAHIVAKHAGYNVVEMNASDDRSAEVFRNKMEAATQMKAVLGADPRPNCLIIDEIDGAPQAAINTLLALIRRTDQSTTKKKNEGGLLLRPIICVCNDQYVPSLRQLRQQALLLHFPPTESTRLASRLYEVVRRESIRAEMNALLCLCEKSDNDIRSCLNTLQFVREQQKVLNMKFVQSVSIGQKDAQKSLFYVWQQIFTMPRPKRTNFVNVHDIEEGQAAKTKTSNTSPAMRFQHVLCVVQAAGEYEKMVQGLFENYLAAKTKDTYLAELTLATDWLCDVDLISEYTAHQQDYQLMKYVPYLAVTFHLLYASFQPPKIQFPRSQYENWMKQTKCVNLVTSLMTDMPPAVKKFLSLSTMILDVLPPFLGIIHPSLRPVNTQLYSKREKEEMANLVSIMIAYNLTYHQEKTPEGQYTYLLNPNIEEIVKLPGLKQHKQLTYAAKQLIAREVELEKMRRNEARTNPNSVESKERCSGMKDNIPAVPNHMKKLTPVISEEKPAKDYFCQFTRTKRIKAVPTAEETKDEKKKEVLDTAIWFHFKEGYSNAVRRSVKVQDFL